MMSGKSQKFNAWINELMFKNRIETVNELAGVLGVTRQTIHSWKKHPEKLKRVTLEGIRSLLGDDDHDLKDLESTFGEIKNVTKTAQKGKNT